MANTKSIRIFDMLSSKIIEQNVHQDGQLSLTAPVPTRSDSVEDIVYNPVEIENYPEIADLCAYYFESEALSGEYRRRNSPHTDYERAHNLYTYDNILEDLYDIVFYVLLKPTETREDYINNRRVNFEALLNNIAQKLETTNALLPLVDGSILSGISFKFLQQIMISLLKTDDQYKIVRWGFALRFEEKEQMLLYMDKLHAAFTFPVSLSQLKEDMEHLWDTYFNYDNFNTLFLLKVEESSVRVSSIMSSWSSPPEDLLGQYEDAIEYEDPPPVEEEEFGESNIEEHIILTEPDEALESTSEDLA